jgi:Flp pilus assembly pilin Flp
VAHGLAEMAADRRGVVAVEFALLAPFLIVLLIGLFEVVSLVRVSFKLSHASNELAKLVAQTPFTQSGTSIVAPAVTGGRSGTLGDYCTGVGYELTPYASSGLAGQIVSVTSAAGGAPAKDWESDNACPTAASAFSGQAVTLATSYSLTPNPTDSAIVVKVSYTYKPILHYLLGSSWTLTQTAFARPRGGTKIACSSGCT